MLFGASSFQLAVDAPNWTGVPALEHYRAFYLVINPGTFFQTLLPAALLALLAALVCNWRPMPATRWRLAGALAHYDFGRCAHIHLSLSPEPDPV